MTNQAYWRGKRPSDGKRWKGATSAEELSANIYSEPLFRMYRRYAKQWNEIELDRTRSLSEHTHTVCGSRVVGAPGMFVLHCDVSRENGWILEMKFARGFHQYHPGWSTGLNALRSTADVARSVLHWRGAGKEAFDHWLDQERAENAPRGEWLEYKA